MISLIVKDHYILVLDAHDIEAVKDYKVATPDDKVSILYTPDSVWLVNQIARVSGQGDALERAEQIAHLIDQSREREEIGAEASVQGHVEMELAWDWTILNKPRPSHN